MKEGQDSTNMADPNHALGAVCAAMIDRFGGEAEAIIRELCARRGATPAGDLAEQAAEGGHGPAQRRPLLAQLPLEVVDVVDVGDDEDGIARQRAPEALQD